MIAVYALEGSFVEERQLTHGYVRHEILVVDLNTGVNMDFCCSLKWVLSMRRVN